MPNSTLEKWEEKTLGEVCTITAGQSPESQFYNTEGNGLPFYQGKKEFTNKYIGAPTVWTTKITKEALAGDILMSVRAPVGPINYATQKCCIGRGLASIRKSEKISNDFLFYYLLSMQEEIGGHDGAVFNSISRNEIATLKIKLPPLSEQQRIVGILDEAFENIEKAKQNTLQNLNNAKELFNGYLENLNYPKEKLADFIDIKTGKLDSNAKCENGKYPFFTCSREIFKIDSYAFDCEAILLAGNNASGDFNVKHYNGKFNAYQRTYVITIKNTNLLLYRFLYYQLLKSLHKFKQMSVGANTKFLKIGMINNFEIQLPTMSEQQKIVSQLDELQEQTKKLEQIYTQKLQDLDELKQSLLQKAFNGEL